MNTQPVLLCQPCALEESSIHSIDSQIINNIVRFLSNNKNGGPDTYINKITKNANALLATYRLFIHRIKSRNRYHMTKIRDKQRLLLQMHEVAKTTIASTILNPTTLTQPKYQNTTNTSSRHWNCRSKSLICFLNSDESLSIESDAHVFKVIMLVTPDSPHPQRVWRVNNTGKRTIWLIHAIRHILSTISNKFTATDRFVPPSLTTFLHYLCKWCVRNPTFILCVDIHTS